MRKYFKKLLAILVLVMLFMNSSSIMQIISIAKDIDAIDEEKANVFYDIALQKYVNYSIDSDIGVLVKLKLKTGIEYIEQEYKPLSETQVVLQLPKIGEEYPRKC